MKVASMIIGFLMLLDIPSVARSYPQAILSSVYVLAAGALILFPLYIEFIY